MSTRVAIKLLLIDTCYERLTLPLLEISGLFVVCIEDTVLCGITLHLISLLSAASISPFPSDIFLHPNPQTHPFNSVSRNAFILIRHIITRMKTSITTTLCKHKRYAIYFFVAVKIHPGSKVHVCQFNSNEEIVLTCKSLLTTSLNTTLIL